MTTFSQFNTGSSEAQLIEAARLGETSGLVEHIYALLRVKAVFLVGRFQAFNRSLEVDDLLQEGIEQVIRDVEKALSHASPVGWLLVAAKHRMLHYCEEYRSPIRVPHTAQWRGAHVPLVMSLDAPLVEGEDMTLLDLLAS